MEDQYCLVIITVTKRLNHVDTSLISYSVWPIRQICSPNIFPALAVQSVSKWLKVFSGILVAELFSVYVFPETLSLYINHQSNVWTMTKESYNLYVYFIIAIFSNQFYPYLKLKMARHCRGQVLSQKKKNHIACFKPFKTALAIRYYFWYFKLR